MMEGIILGAFCLAYDVRRLKEKGKTISETSLTSLEVTTHLVEEERK